MRITINMDTEYPYGKRLISFSIEVLVSGKPAVVKDGLFSHEEIKSNFDQAWERVMVVAKQELLLALGKDQ